MKQAPGVDTSDTTLIEEPSFDESVLESNSYIEGTTASEGNTRSMKTPPPRDQRGKKRMRPCSSDSSAEYLEMLRKEHAEKMELLSMKKTKLKLEIKLLKKQLGEESDHLVTDTYEML